MKKLFRLVGFILVGTVALVALMVQHKGEDRVWSISEKANLCKAYIGSMFNQPAQIIDHYKTDEKGLVYVKYKRPSDSSEWRYVCEITGSSMIWTAWLKYESRWGRWREEDRVSLHYKGKKVTFTSPDTGEMVSVVLE